MADFLITELDISALQAELHSFEQRYKVPSYALTDAFKVDGRLVETPDFLRWDFVFGVLENAGALP